MADPLSQLPAQVRGRGDLSLSIRDETCCAALGPEFVASEADDYPGVPPAHVLMHLGLGRTRVDQ